MKVSALVAACHDASCRPPTSGGTGGSKGSTGPSGGPTAAQRKAYNAGYKSGQNGGWDALGRADQRGAPIEWKVGWMDADAGHPKGHAFTSPDYGDLFGGPAAPTVKPKVSKQVSADASPHYLKRTEAEVNPMPEAAALALVRAKDATGRRILDKGVEVPDGKVVGVRANLNVKKSTGVTVQTLHDGTQAQLDRGTGLFGGEAIGYGAVVRLRNAQFSVNQDARAKIATGQSNKFPMASVDGQVTARHGGDTFDGVELRFNPMREHLFVDPDGRPVRSASSVTIIGSRVFARGFMTYWGTDDMPQPVDGVPTVAKPVD